MDSSLQVHGGNEFRWQVIGDGLDAGTYRSRNAVNGEKLEKSDDQ